MILKPSAAVKGLATIQVYSDFFMPGKAYDVRFFYFGKPDPPDILASVKAHLVWRGERKRLAKLKPFARLPKVGHEIDRWARALFSVARPRFVLPTLLHSSLENRRKRLSEGKVWFRSRALVVVAAAGILSTLAVLLVVWRSRRRRMAHAADMDIKLKGRGGFEVFMLVLVMGIAIGATIWLFMLIT